MVRRRTRSAFAELLGAVMTALACVAGSAWASDAAAKASALGGTVLRPRLEAPQVPAPPQVRLPDPGDPQLLLSRQELRVPAGVRVLLFAPHPDDETLAAGGLIQRAHSAGGTVRVVFVTNGDAYVDGVRRELKRLQTSTTDFIEYGERRHREALHALQHLGLRGDDALFLGFPDDGIDDLWAGHWSSKTPYRSPYTRFDRPRYKESLSRRVEYAGSDLEGEIQRTIQAFAPDWIVVPDPRDRHPDHCTTGVFVLDALRKLRQEGDEGARRTRVLTYLVHAPDYPASPAWVREIAGAGVGGSTTGGRTLSATQWVNLPLSATELAGKRGAMAAYESQILVMNPFLKQFLRSVELFGQLDAAQVMAVPFEYAARFGRPR